ncbi:MAG: threonylcarbamoyl-AMP synthase [Eubacteriaceae bacterium]|nr:threonylcarbamoyl-AMP synthase [Eubacteriaceae bacterium]
MSKAQIFDLNEQETYSAAMQAAARAIWDGGIVVFPTETVYGLGADASSPEAVSKIFAAKGRPADNPLIIHLASPLHLTDYARDVPKQAMELAAELMPGPLTLVLKKKGGACREATAGLDTIALRVPSSPFALDFLSLSARAIAAPSANISGRPSPTKPEHALADMRDRADVVLLGGDCAVGLESTVLDCTVWPFAILRPGAIGVNELARYCPSVQGSGEEGQPRAPGMKYRHYKPDCRVVALDMAPDAAHSYLSALGEEKGAIYFLFDGAAPHGFESAFSLGSYSSPEKGAAKLYWALREADRLGFAKAYVECPLPSSIGEAFRNRLYKAADEIAYGEGMK